MESYVFFSQTSGKILVSFTIDFFCEPQCFWCCSSIFFLLNCCTIFCAFFEVFCHAFNNLLFILQILFIRLFIVTEFSTQMRFPKLRMPTTFTNIHVLRTLIQIYQCILMTRRWSGFLYCSFDIYNIMATSLYIVY